MGLVAFAPEHLDAVAAFSAAAWDRPRSAEWLAWRYLQGPGPRAWLYTQGDRVVSMVGFFARTWRWGGQERTVHETHDWWTLPELAGSGLGMRPIMKLMAMGTPIVATGGSEDTVLLLPRLKWEDRGVVAHWVLPQCAEDLAHQVAEQKGWPEPAVRVAAAGAVRSWFAARRRGPPPGWRWRPVSAPGDELRQLYRGDGLIALPDETLQRWQLTGPGGGVPMGLYAYEGSRLAGWALGQVVVQDGRPRGRVLDAYVDGPQDVLDRLVGALLHRLAAHHPQRIDAWCATDDLATAYKNNHLLRVGERPVRIWPGKKGEAVPTGPLRVAGLVNDLPLLPYPSKWPDV